MAVVLGILAQVHQRLVGPLRVRQRILLDCMRLGPASRGDLLGVPEDAVQWRVDEIVNGAMVVRRLPIDALWALRGLPLAHG